MGARPATTERRRWRTIALLAAASLLSGALPGQTPPPAAEPKQGEAKQGEAKPGEGKPAEPKAGEGKPPPSEPKDPVREAAEILRKKLGLEPGPQGTPPAGPPPVPPAEALPTTAPPQDPENRPPPPQDPSDTAAKSLQKLTTPDAPPRVMAPPPSDAQRFAGSFALRYRARHGAGATDQDVVARLDADLGDEERDMWTAHVRTRAFWDADGRRTDDPFAGLDQSFGDEFDARLYAAHIDVHRSLGLALLRFGRQDLDETPTIVTFDGVRADSQRWGGSTQLWVSAYGGVPVHQFEASPHGDSVVGVAGGLVPWRGGRVRADAMNLRDEYLAVDREDTLLGARWWQSVGEVQLHGLHTWRDGSPRDLVVGANGPLPDALPGGPRFSVTWRELLSTQRQEVTEIDPFFDIGFDYAPYRQLETTLDVDATEHVSVGIGADVRWLRDGADERAFNREFEHYRAFASWDDLFVPGLSASVSGSLWDSSGEEFRTVTGDLTWRPDRDLRTVLGSAYDLFRYDLFEGRERLHVRSWYVRVQRRAGYALLDAAYEVERDDDDEFHLFRVGVTWTF
ncbi:MAG: hypothetical protein JNK78_01325 [Planctomycetes bacterium]|nr:hypothetical protein [Planctomycetota bacterium]